MTCPFRLPPTTDAILSTPLKAVQTFPMDVVRLRAIRSDPLLGNLKLGTIQHNQTFVG
jgi:hypothetical protein